MAPGLRKFVLTVHVVASVGWLGAVVAYLALNNGSPPCPATRHEMDSTVQVAAYGHRVR